MRIVSGTARGRRLLEPDGMKIRPTTDKVKESMFNIIQFDIEGRRILDLFAGSGQLGLEAMSRGAESCVFVDESPDAIKLINENIRRSGITSGLSVVHGDSFAFLERGGKFDVIILDPPYDTECLERALERIIEFDILKENGIIICESKAEKAIHIISAAYCLRREYLYGKIKISLIVKGE